METLERFITAKSAAGLSPQTLRWYRLFVGDYLAWCDGQQREQKKPDTVSAYLSHLRGRNMSANTVSGCYRSLSVYFNWLVARDELDRSPMRLVQRPKLPRLRMNHVTLAYFRSIYAAIEGHGWMEYRDRCIMLVLLFSGLRAAELVALHPPDVDPSKRIITVNAGKGDKARPVPYHPDLTVQLERYLDTRPRWRKPHLWLSNDGSGGTRGPMTVYALRGLLERRAGDAGIHYQNPHSWRHGFAMLMLNSGMSLSAVSVAMGHSSVKVTEEFYAHWVTNGLLREYDTALRKI